MPVPPCPPPPAPPEGAGPGAARGGPRAAPGPDPPPQRPVGPLLQQPCLAIRSRGPPRQHPAKVGDQVRARPLRVLPRALLQRLLRRPRDLITRMLRTLVTRRYTVAPQSRLAPAQC